MGNLDVDKAMQTLVEHGFIDKDGHPINIRSNAISRHKEIVRELPSVTPKLKPCEDAISRQAAINTIESWLLCDDYNNAERHIMRAMQSVLYDLPSVKTQEPCEDWYGVPSDEMTLEQARQAVKDLRKKLAECLKQEPCEDEKQRTGHWIECEEEVKCFCSECKEISDYPTQFCPNCGARMVEPRESEEQDTK